MDKAAKLATKEMLDQYLEDGWISPSNTHYAVNMFPVPKKDGTYRQVYNYPMINQICFVNKYPIPNLRDKVNTVVNNKFRIALDLRSAYNQIRITDPLTQELTTFSTEYGNFKWNVMPFGLADAPPFFQAFMNSILMEKLDKSVLTYLDDVLVYGKTKDECIDNCKCVLKRFRDNHLFCKISKCEFFPDTVDYLGYAIRNGSYLPLNGNKLESLTVPQNVKELKGLLGLLQWFSPFIKDLAKFTAPLFDFCKPNVPWDQNKVKTLVTNLSNHIELHPLAGHNDDDQFIIVSDASDFWGSGLLYQRFGGDSMNINDFQLYNIEQLEKEVTQGKTKLVHCYSFKFNDTKLNYGIFDKERLAVIKTLEHSRYFLKNTVTPIGILTDNKALSQVINGAISSKVEINRRLRYKERLLQFNIISHYIPGSTNSLADALSRPKISHFGTTNQWKLELARELADVYYNQPNWYNEQRVNKKRKRVLPKMISLDHEIDELISEFRTNGEQAKDGVIKKYLLRINLIRK